MKTFVLVTKVIPMLLAFCHLVNTILSYFYIDCIFAISKMESTNPSMGEVVHVVRLDKEAVDALLKTYVVTC